LTDILRGRVFGRLRTALGGRLRFFMSGGAQRPGNVGQVLPGTQVKIAAGGEILVSGPGVLQGYWESPEQTREALQGGWFHTGDIGELDAGNFLAITDRKKDMIVTAVGENIAPQLLEKLLKTDKLIANALVYGDRRPFLTALLVPNFDNLNRYAHIKRIDFLTHCDLINHPQILALMRRRVEALQQGQPGFMQIKRFSLLSRDFLAESGELSQTMKIKPVAIAKKISPDSREHVHATGSRYSRPWFLHC
jgi:long-chain acyl-CoA synthetase